MAINPEVKDTIESELACLRDDVWRLLAMLAEDDADTEYQITLSGPRYLDYRELARGMAWDLTRIGILLAAPVPALTVGTASPAPASAQGGRHRD